MEKSGKHVPEKDSSMKLPKGSVNDGALREGVAKNQAPLGPREA
jgi:hypothetical protein